MDIFYKKKILKRIDNHYDLELLITELKLFKYFKKIPIQFFKKIDQEIEMTDQINFKGLKKWYRDIVNYPESIYDNNFLKLMGWEENEVYEFISNKQKENSKKLSDKKINNPELYYDKSPKRIEYWTKKGFSEKESIEIISKSQRTFSKNICIEKYGENKGMEIFNSRQKKWINTLNSNCDLLELNSRKNSYRYGYINIENLIERSSFLDETKQIILECIKQKNISDFVECVLSKIDVKSLSDIIPYITSNIVSKHYNEDKGHIKKTFLDIVSNKLCIGYYGQPVYNNGIRYKSVKEYKLSILLEETNNDFIYERRYPNSRFISDFYLPKYNLYIEYFGILDKKNINNLDEKQLMYYNKMNEKILFCEKNKINLIHDTNFNKLYEKLKTII
jgi:hypothetical protein